MLPKKTKKYSFNYCSCCQRQKQLRLKISTSTYLLRASSAALSFGLKNKTELKNVTDRLNRWCFIVFEMLLCASGPGLDIIQLLLLKHLHNYTFLGPKILKIKPKKTPTSQTSTSASGGATSSALLQGHHLYKCYLKNPKKYSSVSNLFWSSFSNNTQKTVNWFARGLNEPFNYCSCCQQQKQLRLKISTSTYLLTRSSIERLNEEMEKIKTFVKLYSQNHEERGYTTPTSGRATTTSQTPTWWKKNQWDDYFYFWAHCRRKYWFSWQTLLEENAAVNGGSIKLETSLEDMDFEVKKNSGILSWEI